MYKFLRKVDNVFVLFDIPQCRGIVATEDEMKRIYSADELENSEDYAYIETMNLLNSEDDIFTLTSVPSETQLYVVASVLNHQFVDGKIIPDDKANYMVLNINTHETKEIDYATLLAYINDDKCNVLNASCINGKVEFLPYSYETCGVIHETN